MDEGEGGAVTTAAATAVAGSRRQAAPRVLVREPGGGSGVTTIEMVSLPSRGSNTRVATTRERTMSQGATAVHVNQPVVSRRLLDTAVLCSVQLARLCTVDSERRASTAVRIETSKAVFMEVLSDAVAAVAEADGGGGGGGSDDATVAAVQAAAARRFLMAYTGSVPIRNVKPAALAAAVAYLQPTAAWPVACRGLRSSIAAGVTAADAIGPPKATTVHATDATDLSFTNYMLWRVGFHTPQAAAHTPVQASNPLQLRQRPSVRAFTPQPVGPVGQVGTVKPASHVNPLHGYASRRRLGPGGPGHAASVAGGNADRILRTDGADREGYERKAFKATRVTSSARDRG